MGIDEERKYDLLLMIPHSTRIAVSSFILLNGRSIAIAAYAMMAEVGVDSMLRPLVVVPLLATCFVTRLVLGAGCVGTCLNAEELLCREYNGIMYHLMMQVIDG